MSWTNISVNNKIHNCNTEQQSLILYCRTKPNKGINEFQFKKNMQYMYYDLSTINTYSSQIAIFNTVGSRYSTPFIYIKTSFSTKWCLVLAICGSSLYLSQSQCVRMCGYSIIVKYIATMISFHELYLYFSVSQIYRSFGWIAGAVVGGIILISVIVVIVFMLCAKMKAKKNRTVHVGMQQTTSTGVHNNYNNFSKYIKLLN